MRVKKVCFATKLMERVVVVLEETTVVQKAIRVALEMGIVTMMNTVQEN